MTRIRVLVAPVIKLFAVEGLLAAPIRSGEGALAVDIVTRTVATSIEEILA